MKAFSCNQFAPGFAYEFHLHHAFDQRSPVVEIASLCIIAITGECGHLIPNMLQANVVQTVIML